MKSPLVLCLSVLLWGCTVCAQTVIEDDFESGSVAPAWALSEGVTVSSSGGARNSISSARLSGYSGSAGRELGGRFDAVAPEGVRDFALEFYFRTRSTAERQFHLHVSTSTGPVGSGAPAISLRYQGGWQAYDGAGWRSVPGLGSGVPEMWHRARVTGQDWGSPGARWAVQFAPGGSADFTGVATNLTWFQGGNPAALPARFFVFTTVYGNNPGFDVDEVLASVSNIVPVVSNAIVKISGTYPHLAVFSTEGEAGIGAVMPWAGRLWFITYPPHNPNGGADKLWMVDSNLTLTAHPASVGGTHANRMIHRESQQMIIGPYFVDTNANVRVVPPSQMPGRLTGNARHLSDSSNKVYFASMEEGLYSVDVNTLAVEVLKPDVQAQTSAQGMIIPGNHGKGLYSGQGRLFYANNGEPSWSISMDPRFEAPAGLLAETTFTDVTGWKTVERKAFTEITGPGSLMGNTNVGDPVWALGWDKRSVLLKTLQDGLWHDYRLPKGSYTHDAFHGWYTEWPRIREILPGTSLMHMHGLFYRFPGQFRPGTTAGLEPICTYLKMPVDYCWWNSQLVMARDDASTTGANTWAGQSHSAPWFGQIADLRKWGTPSGFGGPWVNDAVSAQVPSPPFFVGGFTQRVLHLKNESEAVLDVLLQHDSAGQGTWSSLETVTVPKQGYRWYVFPASLDTCWLRLVPQQTSSNVTAYLHLSNPPQLPSQSLVSGLARADSTGAVSLGIIRPQSGDARTLQFAATTEMAGGVPIQAYYEINGSLKLLRTTNVVAEQFLRTNYSLSSQPFSTDGTSVIFMEGTNRFRLPKSSMRYDQPFAVGWPRSVREVVTERRLVNVHGTFYELPLASSGGFRRVRPISTHNLQITDFASWRGLFVATGVSSSAEASEHIVRSDDGRAGLWFGNVDDLWRFGAPAGHGGPWRGTEVLPQQPSDPYLMLGYQHKVLDLSHEAQTTVVFTIEVDFLGDSTWSEYGRFAVQPGEKLRHAFPAGYSAHWVRLKSDIATAASALFTYGPLPRITDSGMVQGKFRFAFTGHPGQPYAVLSSDNISHPVQSWTPVTTGTFTTETITWQEPLLPGSDTRFFGISSGF